MTSHAAQVVFPFSNLGIIIMEFEFIPTVAEKLDPLYESGSRHNVIRGGRGSTKSRGVGEYLLYKSFEGKHRILCTREYQNSMEDSVKAELESSIEIYGLRDFFHITDNKIFNKITDSVFKFKGMQKPDSIKSMSKLSFCWIEEAHTISKRSINKLVNTIREPGAKLIWTYNPEFEMIQFTIDSAAIMSGQMI